MASLKILPSLHFPASIKEGLNLIKQVKERMQAFYISLDQVKQSSGVNFHSHLTHTNIPHHLKANDNSRKLSLKRTTLPQGIYIARKANDMYLKIPRPAAYHIYNSGRDEDFPTFNGNNLESWPNSIEYRPGLLYKTIIEGQGKRTAQVGDKVTFKCTPYDRCTKQSEKGNFQYKENDKLKFLKLGDCEFGKGFYDGILGMKCDETRRLAIHHDPEPPHKTKSWNIYDVTLVAIDRTQ